MGSDHPEWDPSTADDKPGQCPGGPHHATDSQYGLQPDEVPAESIAPAPTVTRRNERA